MIIIRKIYQSGEWWKAVYQNIENLNYDFYEFPTEQSYRVFDNERNKVLVYHFGQKDAYDVGHVAKVSYTYDILIFGF